jgi:hypothetical protein
MSNVWWTRNENGEESIMRRIMVATMLCGVLLGMTACGSASTENVSGEVGTAAVVEMTEIGEDAEEVAKVAEEAAKKAEQEAVKKAEEEAVKKVQEEAAKKAEEEAANKVQEEAAKKAEQEAVKKAEEAAEYYGAAEPPVRCGESHLSGLTEPPVLLDPLLSKSRV